MRWCFSIVVLVCFALVPTVGAAPAQMSEERLTERADAIATGAVRRILVSEEGSRTSYIAEVTVESCSKGALAEGDVLRVEYHTIAPAPFTVGSSGHTFIPKVGQRIDVFVHERDGVHEALFPNGMREAESLMFVQVHDAEAYDALIEECLRMDRYLLGLDFAARRLTIGWDRDAARALFRFGVRTGAYEPVLEASTNRLRTHPEDHDALMMATMLAWELRDDLDVFGHVLEFGRNQEHAGVVVLLAMQFDWQGAEGAFALYKEAIDMDPGLGIERLARTAYTHAIDCAADSGEREAYEAWLAYARERWPEDEANWSLREFPGG